MKKIIVIFAFISSIYGQDVFGFPQPTTLISIPTAGLLDKGSYLTELRLLTDGGLLANISVGISDQFMFGLSYGGTQIIGTGEISPQDWLGTNVRYRILDETTALPAFTIGYNSQGGKVNVLGLGVFVVVSKNYEFFGNFGIHGCLNKLVNGEGKEKSVNLFLGLDKDINKDFSLNMEYNAALNNDQLEWGEFNWGLRWTFAQKLHLELNMTNVALEKQTKFLIDANREIKITFVEYFN